MPIALIAIAWLLVMTGINGNWTAVGTQIQTDGPGFVQYLVGILGISIFFRLIGMPNAGRVFLILVLLVFIIQNNNVLTLLENVATNGLTSTTTAATTTAATTPATSAASGTGVGSATPLTTPAPVAGGTPSGQGGIGSA